MKPELTLRLLCILSTCLASYSNSISILKRQTGTVAIGDTTYFSLTHQFYSPLAIVLRSLQGDCDLYLSQQVTTKRPTYKKYDLCSTTCGTDHIIILPSLKYPLYIGVFAYPSNTYCEFQVDIVQLEANLDPEDPEIGIQFDIEAYVLSNEGVKESSEEQDSIWQIVKFILQILEVLV